MRPFHPAHHVPRAHRSRRFGAALIALALLGGQAGPARAATYYVDQQSPSCSSSGAGTEAEPYCTIAAAVAARAGAGNTIVVKPGIYREQVSIPVSGAPDLPFVIRAQGPGVVIDGADDFSGADAWVEMAPRDLPFDHALASYDNPWLAPAVIWSPEQVIVDGRRLRPSAASPALLPNDAFTWVSGEGLYVNIGGANPGLHEVLVGRRRYGVTMNAKSWVTIEGLEITRSESRGISLGAGCADVVLSGNRVTRSASYGILAIGATRAVIERSVVSECGLHGIGVTAGSSECIVRDNESYRNVDPNIRRANGIYLHSTTGITLHGNRVHGNQDSGMQFSGGAAGSICYNNQSWLNGDHGYDHLGAPGTVHVNDVAFGNHKDGFSIEGDSPYTRLHNCIGVDNGLTTDQFDLWVNELSSVGFVSDYNIFWNSTGQEPFKYIHTKYATLAGYQAASGQDAHSRQVDPGFVNALAGDFALAPGSPGIDAGTAEVPNWPPTDAAGHVRVDDPLTVNSGAGPVLYADIGAIEYLPATDLPPVVSSPGIIRRAPGSTVTFTVAASDPDGSPIHSLVMVPVDMPAGHGAVFTPNATRTTGTFSWKLPLYSADWTVRFVATNSHSGSGETDIRVRWWYPSGAEPSAEGTVPGDQEIPGGHAGDPALAIPVAAELAFSNPFPNPSRGPVEFALVAPRDAELRWEVFDLQGRMVWSEQRTIPAGRTLLRWEGRTTTGDPASTGVYLVRAMVDGVRFGRRVVRF